MKILLAVLYTLLAGVNLQAESAAAILSRMDQTAPAFHNMSADLQMTTFTAIINDKTAESGTLKMQRLKPGVLRAIIEFKGASDARTISFQGNVVRVYYPKGNFYQDYDVGKNSDVLNQFLLLGFGSSGKELAESYEISELGSDKVSGQETTKLSLVPKSASVKERLSKIEIWIPTGAAYPIQQKFYEPSGNYRIVSYGAVNLKPQVKGTLEFKMPKGAKKQG